MDRRGRQRGPRQARSRAARCARISCRGPRGHSAAHRDDDADRRGDHGGVPDHEVAAERRPPGQVPDPARGRRARRARAAARVDRAGGGSVPAAHLDVRTLHPDRQLLGAGARADGADGQHQRHRRLRRHHVGVLPLPGPAEAGRRELPEALRRAPGCAGVDGAADAGHRGDQPYLATPLALAPPLRQHLRRRAGHRDSRQHRPLHRPAADDVPRPHYRRVAGIHLRAAVDHLPAGGSGRGTRARRAWA